MYIYSLCRATPALRDAPTRDTSTRDASKRDAYTARRLRCTALARRQFRATLRCSWPVVFAQAYALPHNLNNFVLRMSSLSMIISDVTA